MSQSASRQYHLTQLAALCSAHPLAQKVVFAPTLQIGHNLGTALARSGVSWANLHMTTPAHWAERVAGLGLRASGRRPLVQDADHFYMLDRLRRATWPDGHPFAEGNASTRLTRTFLRTIRGLRLADVAPDELRAARIALDGRDVFVDMYRDYCAWLEKHMLYDRAELFRAASERASGELVVAVLDETPLPELAFRFVRGLSGNLYRIGRTDYGKPAPQHAARRRFEQADFPVDALGSTGPTGRAHIDELDATAGDHIWLREAIGIENEVRGALRELLTRGRRLDEIEIVYTTPDPYLPLLVDALEGLDVSASYASGVPVTLTHTGQALIGYYRWIASGFDPEDLIGLLRSRLLFMRREEGEPEVDAADAALVLLEARVAPGRGQWKQALERYAERHREEADHGSARRRALAWQRRAVARWTAAWLDDLVAPVPGRTQLSLAEMATAGIRFVHRFATRETERDSRAAESITDRLEELAAGVEAVGTASDMAASLADLMGDHKVEAAVARSGCVYVVPLDRAGYAGRPHTVIMGLSEATFPGTATEDPILLDEDRERIGGHRLVLQRVRVNEPAWHLVRLLGSAAGHVVLTANRRDLSEGRETYPAALFEQIKEQLEVKHPPTYRIVPSYDEVLTPDEAALALRHEQTTTDDVLHAHPWLDAGLEAVRGRAGLMPTAYDGLLGSPDRALRPDGEKAMSVSRLEELAACPYRYFLRNILHVRPPDVPVDVPGRWLTPLEYGLLLHELLRAFMTAVLSRGERVDAERHAGLMTDLMDEAVSRQRERIPVRTEAGYREDRRRLERTARIFLAEEARRDAQPIGFEVRFGLGDRDGLAVPEPVRVDLSDSVSITLRGSIDRVDATASGYEVWDYKSGSGYDFDEADMLAGGRRLQWALYAYVLDDLLERSGDSRRTVRSGYFFPGEREHGLRLGAPPPPREDVGRALAPLFDMAESGAFLHVQKTKACAFCDYRSICATERLAGSDLDDVIGALAEAPLGELLRQWKEV